VGGCDRSTHLHVGEIHTVEVGEHLVDLGCVLQDGAGRLGQVVQAGVAAQRLGEGADAHHLTQREEEEREAAVRKMASRSSHNEAQFTLTSDRKTTPRTRGDQRNNRLEWALGRAHTFAYHKIGH